MILSCDSENDGCHGGSSFGAYRYIKENNISDETCSNYFKTVLFINTFKILY